MLLKGFERLRGHKGVSKMSSIEIHPSHQIGGGLLNTVLEALQAFANRMAHARQLYRDYLHLSAMSEPELQDIGISRSDILAVVGGTYRRAERPLVTPRKRMPESRSPFRQVARVATEGKHHVPSIQRNNGQRDQCAGEAAPPIETRAGSNAPRTRTLIETP